MGKESKNMNPKNIRQELCEQYGYTDPYKVCCYNCKYCGDNRGKALDSLYTNRCTKRKKDWWASQYCRGFVPKEKE